MHLDKDGLAYFWSKIKAALDEKTGNIVTDIYHVGAEPPENTKLFWVDSQNGYTVKFYNSETGLWQNVGAVWS